MKFRLLAGLHITEGPAGPPGHDGKPTRTELVYRRGDVIESDQNLSGRFGSGKFLRVTEGSTTDPTTAALEQQVADLKAQLAQKQAEAQGGKKKP